MKCMREGSGIERNGGTKVPFLEIYHGIIDNLIPMPSKFKGKKEKGPFHSIQLHLISLHSIPFRQSKHSLLGFLSSSIPLNWIIFLYNTTYSKLLNFNKRKSGIYPFPFSTCTRIKETLPK